jgi:UPF0176 protein
MPDVVVAAFYRFTPLTDPAGLRDRLGAACAAAGLRGSVLLAPEGVNGTLAGTRSGIEAGLAALRALPGCAGLEARESPASEPPFARLKVRLKREIVTMGEAGLDPAAHPGTRVEPRDWNGVISAPDVALIDTRNAYEVALGSFPGAIDPGTASFGEFPDWWHANRGRLAGCRVAMFCTGGIRCEKASSLLLRDGAAEVLQLRGGILAYLDEVPEARSLWRGECYVFDGRVSVRHRLLQGSHGSCHACGRPVSAADLAHRDFEAGVACPACRDEYRAEDRKRFRERQRQIELAAARSRISLG